jgi:uncharacterized membrane protein
MKQVITLAIAGIIVHAIAWFVFSVEPNLLTGILTAIFGLYLNK